MRGNSHVRFLGGWGAAMRPGYPTDEKKPPNKIGGFFVFENLSVKVSFFGYIVPRINGPSLQGKISFPSSSSAKSTRR